jgi:endonuclease YncB( thermonuclease family)
MANNYTFKDYLLNPDADPIAAVTALRGKYMGNSYMSTIDTAARGTFSLATSVLKGTYRYGTLGAQFINRMTRATEKIEHLATTLIGSEKVDNFINFVDQANVDRQYLLKEVGEDIAYYLTGSSHSSKSQMLSSAARMAKLNVAAMIGFNFRMPDIVNKALVLDIETGGLEKDAPILQIALLNMEQVSDARTTALSMANGEFSDMALSMQRERGFVSMNLIPSAIIRDVGGRTPAGDVRKGTYKATEEIPRSLKEFEKKFGSWAIDRYDHVKEFYEEFADPVTGVISDEVLNTKILPELKLKGSLTLSNGKIIYSQREGAKQTLLELIKASKENRSLIVANLPFESYRVGKLIEYHIKALAGNRTGEAPFNLAENAEDIDNLVSDPEIMEALGLRDEAGNLRPAKNLKEFRKAVFAATWSSEHKRNILDSNNFFYTTELAKLKIAGKTNEMISLFPNWMRSVSSGLQTKDQLDLTRMLYSGLMQTGTIAVRKNVMAGAKIDWAVRAFFGEAETHVALLDTIDQGRLLTEGKLLETVSDVFNIWKGQYTNSMVDHFKALSSGFSMLTDSKKRGWVDLTRLLRETLVSVDSPDLISRPVEGSVLDVIREYNIEKEMLRFNETIDEYTARYVLDPSGSGTLKRHVNDAETIYTDRPYIEKEVFQTDAEGKVVTDASGAPQKATARYSTNASEPFTMGEVRGTVRHQQTTHDGRVLYTYQNNSDYNLQDRVRKRYNELAQEMFGEAGVLTEGPGATVKLSTDQHKEVAERVKRELLERLSENESFASRNYSGEDLYNLMRGVVAHFDAQGGAREELRRRMVGGEDKLIEQLIGQTGGGFGAITQRIRQGSRGFSIGGAQEGLESIGISIDEFLPSVQAQQRTTMGRLRMGREFGGYVKNQTKQVAQAIGNFAVTEEAGLDMAANFIGRAFDLNVKDTRTFLGHNSRILGMLGGTAAVAAVAAADYFLDMPSWKPTTGDILKKTGKERNIVESGNYDSRLGEESLSKRSGISLRDVSTRFTGNVQYANDDGMAFSAIDSSKVDYHIDDGDTVDILTKGIWGMGRKKIGTVRLTGMDTPEVYHEGINSLQPAAQPYSQPATQYLKNVLSARTGAQILVGQGGKKSFGRAIGIVTDQSGTNYSYEMVQQGLGSVLYREESTEDIVNQKEFNKAENIARKTSQGMWSQPFYFGAQSGIAGLERKGWNVLTPLTARKFSFDYSPGTTQQQMENATSAVEMNGGNSQLGNGSAQVPPNTFSDPQKNHARKQLMSTMQQDALMNSMQKNRGRGAERR